MAYVERNPVRAGIVENASEYEWSSAPAHLSGRDLSGLLDMQWWEKQRPPNWSEFLQINDSAADLSLRKCTYAGRPFGEEGFVAEIAARFGRYWSRGRPSKKTEAKNRKSASSSKLEESQPELF